MDSAMNDNLTNFWRVLQDEALYRRFRRRVQAIPFSDDLAALPA